MSTDRDNKKDIFLNNIMTQSEWYKKKAAYLKELLITYKDELDEYLPVQNIKEYNKIKVGGYIRYIDSNDILKWGGILLKKIKKNDIDYMIVANTNMKCITVSFYRNTIFYKKHVSASDKTRKMFISYLDKY
jgi:hypothetical protein